ncbi:hypothetical protein ACS0TY_013080 [Phlomoides rotata]
MTRKKITLAYIKNYSDRRVCFKKRKKGLIKKVSELSTLCGVDACAIIYSQFEAEPEVWPSVLGAQRVLARFQKLNTMDRTRKMVNQDTYTRQRIKKAEDQLSRLRNENKRKEMERFMFENLYANATLDHFNLKDASHLGFVINQTLSDIRFQLEILEKNGQVQQALAAPPLPPVAAAPPPFLAPLPPTLALPPPPPLAAVAPPTLASLSSLAGLSSMEMNYDIQGAVEEAAPPLSVEELEGFPWDLVKSPPIAYLDDGNDGWDEGVIPPYSYLFNNNEASTSGTSYSFNNEVGPAGTKVGDGGYFNF